jgi:hypothetical protein
MIYKDIYSKVYIHVHVQMENRDIFNSFFEHQCISNNSLGNEENVCFSLRKHFHDIFALAISIHASCF